MKKLFIALAFAGLSLGAFAQTNDVPTQKYSVATNSFWSNWFIQAGFNWNVWYSGEEHGENLSTIIFKGMRTNPGFAVAVGKWFTPGLGLRTKVQGIWGKRVEVPEGEASTNSNADHGNKYWIAQEQVLFNLSNMLFGYNPNRVWNFIPFAGGGFERTMTYNLYAMTLSVGILNEFRVSKRLAINAEIGWNRMEGDADGIEYVSRTNRGWDCHDNNLYAELGLTFNLGKATWEKTPDLDAIMAQNQAAVDALNAKLRDAQAENDRLKNLLANQKPVESQSVKELITTPISVFFNLDKTNVASKKDLVNVRAIAKYAVDNDRNILVRGYADSATGSAEHNQWLSEQRAKTVAGELVKMGVNESKISQQGMGGVDALSPISFNRRATVEITE